MNSINNKKEIVKPAYGSVSCRVIEIKTQGVLCASYEGENTGGSSADPFDYDFGGGI